MFRKKGLGARLSALQERLGCPTFRPWSAKKIKGPRPTKYIFVVLAGHWQRTLAGHWERAKASFDAENFYKRKTLQKLGENKVGTNNWKSRNKKFLSKFELPPTLALGFLAKLSCFTSCQFLDGLADGSRMELLLIHLHRLVSLELQPSATGLQQW